MREFYKDTIGKLKLTKGIDQVSNLTRDELTELLNLLEAESKKFKHIKWTDQCKIISQAIIDDKEFYGLNVSKVNYYLSKWWNSQTEKRQRELSQQHHEQSEAEKKQAEHYKKEFERKAAQNPNHLEDLIAEAKSRFVTMAPEKKSRREELRTEKALKESYIAQVERMEATNESFQITQPIKEQLEYSKKRLREIDEELQLIGPETPGRFERMGAKSILPDYNLKK
ncbi:MAG: hypothetical protein NXI20_28385 [bacterium]|nr:hypothetical protein [bacterium]